MITIEKKDLVLNQLMSEDSVRVVFKRSEFENVNISSEALGLILNQFSSMNLISLSVTREEYIIRRTADCYDFHRRGGFKVQEEILLEQLNLLGLEVEKLSQELEPSFSNRLNQITTILASTTAIVTAFMKGSN